jgi:crotonobetainyl-CoA:carnitine CoA-transferase CaiB-like acyl-CoA transferase
VVEREQRNGPLARLVILELANVVAGPSVGRHLADFGAHVIKVERPGDGDGARSMGEPLNEGDDSAWWLQLGRNKTVITLDLRHPEGVNALLLLVERADALIDSFRPGVLERLGLAPEVLHRRNPGLVVLRISGFGQTGPYRSRPGFGTLAEAFAGLAAINGYPDRPPLLAPAAIPDEVAGLFGTWALLAALYHRDVGGGGGQTIDVSLYESLLSILGPLPALYHHRGHLQERRGSRLPFSSPRNVYESRDGVHFVVSGTTPAAAERAIEMIGGIGMLDDERFADSGSRRDHADELDGLVAAWFGQRDAAEIEPALERFGVAGIRVMTMAEIADDAHYRARGSIVSVPDETYGDIPMAAPVPRMSTTPGHIRHAGRPLGHDTARVLAGLGYTDAAIEDLRRAGAC